MATATQDKVHIVCPHCAVTNRVLRDRLREGRCGSCKHALFDGHPVELNASTFDRVIANTGVPVVVDFWAAWCGPCRMMAPAFERAAQDLEPAFRLGKLNTEEAPDIAARYGIRSIPTVVVFRDGREVARQSGAMDYQTLTGWLRRVA